VVIKTQEDEGLISDMAATFDNLRKFKMMLNPEKCTSGVPIGKLIGYMVSHYDIDPNLEKVLAITKMKPPESLHDVQKLMVCMAALSRFISRLGVRGLPFFKGSGLVVEAHAKPCRELRDESSLRSSFGSSLRDR
jgi:hypothetical protein